MASSINGRIKNLLQQTVGTNIIENFTTITILFVVFWLDVFKNTNHQRTSGDFATIVSFARKEKQNTQEKKKNPKEQTPLKKKIIKQSTTTCT